MRIVAISLLALSLGGCVTTGTTVRDIKGACDVFPRPTQAVVASDRYSRLWVNTTIARGMAACGWPRPPARKAATS